MNPNLKPAAQIGDLVTLDGYGRRLFRLDAYTHEISYDEDGPSEDIWYDVSCVITGEYTVGSHDDIVLVCKAQASEKFLDNYQHPAIKPLHGGLEIVFTADYFEDYAPKPKPALVKAPIQSEIDGFLDEINDIRSLIATIGDADGEYQRNLDEAKAKLRTILEGV